MKFLMDVKQFLNDEYIGVLTCTLAEKLLLSRLSLRLDIIEIFIPNSCIWQMQKQIWYTAQAVSYTRSVLRNPLYETLTCLLLSYVVPWLFNLEIRSSYLTIELKRLLKFYFALRLFSIWEEEFIKALKGFSFSFFERVRRVLKKSPYKYFSATISSFS